MISYRTTVSAFSIRGTNDKRGVLLLYSLLATAAMGALAMFISSRLAEISEHVSPLALADMFAMMTLAASLFVVAPAMVAASVGEERRSGTLDLLRTAPLSPTMLVVGVCSAAPAGLFLLLAGPFALHCAAGLLGAYPSAVLLQSVLVLVTGCAALMLMAMLAASPPGRDGGGATPFIVAGTLGLGLLFAVTMATDAQGSCWAFLHPAGALAVLYTRFPGPYQMAMLSSWQRDYVLGHNQAWIATEASFASAVFLIGAGLLLVAARRALAGEAPARFTKHEAIALFSVAVVARVVPLVALVPIADLELHNLAAAAVSLVFPYALCVVGSTPSATAYGSGDAPRMSARGGPFLAATLMVLVALSITIVLYGEPATYIAQEATLPSVLAFLFVIVSFPVYTLFASTRLHTQAARIGFWVGVAVYTLVAFCVWTICLDTHVFPSTLGFIFGKNAVLPGVLGAFLPLFVAWRQRVGERALLSLLA